MIGYGVLLIVGAIVCIAILFFSGRVSWRFYQSTDNTNRLILRVFVWGLVSLLLGAIGTEIGLFPLEKPALYSFMSTVGWITCGALGVLVMREVWGVYQRIRLLRVVNTLKETEQK